jgi:ABC-type Fe3+-hydroxamate transport system substrate-binding protein
MMIPEYLLNFGVNHQVRKIYGISSAGDTVFPSIPEISKLRFYGKPDQELLMKEYITLPVMQEVFFELLMGVFIKTKKSEYKITMNQYIGSTVTESSPCLFIDGVMVKDPSLIVAIDPELVEKIDVVQQKYFVGNYLLDGIVNIITKSADFSVVALPDYAIREPYKVIDPEVSFRSPDYSSTLALVSHAPDFRNTLYWNPSIKTDKEGKASFEFWTSDFKTDFELNIQGITQDGKAFSLRKIIKVNK